MSSNGKNKPATTLESILAYYREAAQSNRDHGDSFERLVARLQCTARLSKRLRPKQKVAQRREPFLRSTCGRRCLLGTLR